MAKKKSFIEKKSLMIVVSSNFVGDVKITGYASDNPFGISGGTIDNNPIDGSIYVIVGIFIGILLFYLVRRIAKNN